MTNSPDDARAESDSRFRTLFEQAPFSAQLLAADGRTLQVNKAWEALWQATDTNGLKSYVLTEYNVLSDPQLQAKGITPYLQRAFAGESVEIPAVIYDPAEIGQEGRARWVKAQAHPIKDNAGQVREVMLIHEDVTERMQNEHALRASEERLRLATDAGNIGIWEWDIMRDKVSLSDRLYTLLGVAPGEFGGTSADFSALVHPDDLQAMWEKINAAIKLDGQFSTEFRVVLPDGSVRWLSTWGCAHANDEGVIERMVGATISIDAYKRAELALKEGDRRKDEFLAMLAHELRNPLAPVSTAAQLLKLSFNDESRVRQFSDIIARQVKHMTELVDDLLDVSRVTRGLVQLQKETLDLKSVIASAIEQARPLIESRRHSLTIWMDADRSSVCGDRTRLVQIFVNLLNNAAKYTPQGGEIALRVQVDDTRVRIDIKDNGLGIEASLLPHVFDLFTQAARTPDRSQGGLGIGLAYSTLAIALATLSILCEFSAATQMRPVSTA